MLYKMDLSMNTTTDDIPKPPASKQLLEVQKLKALIETQTDQMDVLKTSLKTLVNSNNVLMKQVRKLEAKMTKSRLK